jgi:hypothetical protein
VCSERLAGEHTCVCTDTCHRCATFCPFCAQRTCEHCGCFCACERVRSVARRLLRAWRLRAIHYAWRPTGPRARALLAEPFPFLANEDLICPS